MKQWNAVCRALLFKQHKTLLGSPVEGCHWVGWYKFKSLATMQESGVGKHTECFMFWGRFSLIFWHYRWPSNHYQLVCIIYSSTHFWLMIKWNKSQKRNTGFDIILQRYQYQQCCCHLLIVTHNFNQHHRLTGTADKQLDTWPLVGIQINALTFVSSIKLTEHGNQSCWGAFKQSFCWKWSIRNSPIYEAIDKEKG